MFSLIAFSRIASGYPVCDSWVGRDVLMLNRLRYAVSERSASVSLRAALEHAQSTAHESPHTTKLYDQTKDRLTQNEVERIDYEPRPCTTWLRPVPNPELPFQIAPMNEREARGSGLRLKA